MVMYFLIIWILDLLKDAKIPSYVEIYLLVYCELFVFFVVFQKNLKKKSLYPLRLLLCLLVTIGLGIGSGYLRLGFDNFGVRSLILFVEYASFIPYFFFCNKAKPIDLLYEWAKIVLVREAVNNCCSILKAALGMNRSSIAFVSSWPNLANAFLFDLIHVAFLLPMLYFAKEREYREKDKVFVITYSFIIVSLVTLTVIVKTWMVEASGESNTLFIIANILMLSSVLLMLGMGEAAIKSNKVRQERAATKRALAEESKVFDSFRESYTSINCYIHDLKHQLNDVQDALTSEQLKAFKETIGAYEAAIRLGNDVVDAILYEKGQFCSRNNIRFTANGDASILNHIGDADLYTLLNNALGNAIEAAVLVEDEDKRSVGLVISKGEGNAKVEVYNYFSASSNASSLKTNKKDAKSHGYGITSMQLVAERYRGVVSLRVKEDMFFLLIELPLASS